MCLQTKQVYEKVGEATETALVVLAEKMNVLGIDRSKLSRKGLSSASTQALQKLWHKDFTLEFSRDRKSMSCYCTPADTSKVGTTPKMFVKVSMSFNVYNKNQ
jgi:P-type Ca2+ transporter type 2A